MLSVYTTERFDRWFCSLKDRLDAKRIQARIDRIEDGHFGDFKHVGEGVSELRFHFGPGYRVYFIRQGDAVVVLLGGGTKASQSVDIRSAIRLAGDLRS